jgi:hypothetical protein
MHIGCPSGNSHLLSAIPTVMPPLLLGANPNPTIPYAVRQVAEPGLSADSEARRRPVLCLLGSSALSSRQGSSQENKRS